MRALKAGEGVPEKFQGQWQEKRPDVPSAPPAALTITPDGIRFTRPREDEERITTDALAVGEDGAAVMFPSRATYAYEGNIKRVQQAQVRLQREGDNLRVAIEMEPVVLGNITVYPPDPKVYVRAPTKP